MESSVIKCPKCSLLFQPWGHYQSFDEEKWSELAERHNFRLIKIKKIYGTDFRLPRFRFALPVIRLAARIFSVNSLTKLLVVVSK